MPTLPKVDAFVTCDLVHRDPATGKFFVMGTFDEVRAETFPTQLGPIGIYVRLTEMNGSYRFKIRGARGDNEDALVEIDVDPPIVSTDPLAFFEFGFQLPGFPLPVAGAYHLQLMANDQLAHNTSFRAIQVE